jgi:hypothetical protein
MNVLTAEEDFRAEHGDGPSKVSVVTCYITLH